jgi:WD40 repeat protein
MTEDITEAKPLELDWCCGVNTKIDVIDLTTPDTDTAVAFAANHIVVIQNPETGGHYPLLGHRNNVSCLAASPCKRWIASGDYGSSPSVIIWNVETHKGLQVIDGNSHTSIGTGIASIAFSSDSKTLMIMASNSVLTFWRWTDDIPYLYHSETINTPISMLNCPSITSRAVHDFEIFIITCPDKLIFLHIQIKNENVNIGTVLNYSKQTTLYSILHSVYYTVVYLFVEHTKTVK